MRATLVLCFRCLTRDAATERIFLKIQNSRIFHPNNLKLEKKLTVKVRETQTTAHMNLLLNINKLNIKNY